MNLFKPLLALRLESHNARKVPPLRRGDGAVTMIQLGCRRDAKSRLRHDPSAKDHGGGGLIRLTGAMAAMLPGECADGHEGRSRPQRRSQGRAEAMRRRRAAGMRLRGEQPRRGAPAAGVSPG